MLAITKLIRWTVILICAFEGAFFLLITYLSFQFDRGFNSQWIPENLRQNVLFLFTGISSVFAAYLLFTRRSWAKYFCAILFAGLVFWVFVDVFSEKLPDLKTLNWALPPFLGLTLLFAFWKERSIWIVESTHDARA